MKKINLKTLKWVIIGILALIILIVILKTCGKKKIIPIVTHTDTIYRDRFIPDTSDVVMVPNIFTGYITTIKHDTVERWQAVMDTLYITLPDSSKIKYDSRFLTTYPKNPKLVNAAFSMDTVKLTLLKPDGNISTSTYLVDYLKNRYTWYDNTLRKSPLKETYSSINIPKLKLFHTEANLTFTYNPFQQSTQIQTDYSLMYKKLGLYSSILYNTGTTPNAQLNLGIRIKLK